jgi:hypothetical protein
VATASASGVTDSPQRPNVLSITLATTRPCWISVVADGSKLIERTLEAGERHSVDVRDALVITTRDAGAISLTLNGAAGKLLGKDGEAVTARLTPANFKDYLPLQ